jgi:Uma2 family endonuclease
MTAQPMGHVPWSPDLTKQHSNSNTLQDVLNLPDDAPRVELLDGVMIVVPSPTGGHQDIGNLLWLWFRQHASLDFQPLTAVGVAVNRKNTFEPDVVLLRRPVDRGIHYYSAEQVLIAVEVVSPSTRRRDRFEKPVDYANAGIPHYWRIEQDPVHVFAYDLVDGCFKLAVDSAEVLTLRKPFDIELRVRDITP